MPTIAPTPVSPPHSSLLAGSPAPVRPVVPTILEPPVGWQVINGRELWQARELIVFLAWRDIQVRYKQTVLGASWALFQPLMMMVVFSIFFGKLASVPTGGVPYPLFVLTGLLPWTLFAASTTAASNSVVGSERLITKIYFPRLAIPIASIGWAVVDFCVACLLLSLVLLYYGVVPGSRTALAVVAVAAIVLLALGLGIGLSALNVRYRDFKYVIPFFIQVGMFATPSVYMDPAVAARGRYAWLLSLNPMTTLVTVFRSGVLGGPVPWLALTVSGCLALLTCFVGCLYFRKVEDLFADEI